MPILRKGVDMQCFFIERFDCSWRRAAEESVLLFGFSFAIFVARHWQGSSSDFRI